MDKYVNRPEVLGLILVARYHIPCVGLHVGFHGIFRSGTPGVTADIYFFQKP